MTTAPAHAQHTHEQRTARAGVRIPEAAEALGLSPGAVRMRLLRGQLAGAKDTHGWLVFLGEAPVAPAQTHARTGAHGCAACAVRQSEVDYLRGALEREQAASAELRRLLAMHMPALMPATAPEKPASGPAEAELVRKAPRPWWRFWRT